MRHSYDSLLQGKQRADTACGLGRRDFTYGRPTYSSPRNRTIIFLLADVQDTGSKPIPTRFPAEELAKIDAASQSMGLGRSAFIRFCVNMFVRAYQRSGNTILPGNWEEIVRALDNRTREGNGARWPGKKSTS